MIKDAKRSGFAAVIAISLALTFFSCKHKTENPEEPQTYCIPDSLYPDVTYDTVKRENVVGELVLTGQVTVDEDKQVKVYPLASGNTKEVYVELGDHVEKGQLLALIHSPDMAGYISAAYSSIRDLAISKTQLQQTEALYKAGIAAQVDLITAQKNYEKQISVTNMNNEILKVYGGDTTNLSDYYITAPVSGFIVEKGITPGTEIRSDNGDDLFTIADLSEVWAVPNIFEADIAKIKVGYDADVTSLSYGDKIFKGKIDKIFNIVTPDTKVMNVRVKLQNHENLLKPGMFARIVVPYSDGQPLLMVSSTAVVFEDNQNYVLRYKNKCGIDIQPITVLRDLHGKTYISHSALNENDVIIDRYSLFILNDISNMR